MAKFNEDELFCSNCLTPDRFFRGGGSWAPDCCPKCGGTDCTMYKDLALIQKMIVQALEIEKILE